MDSHSRIEALERRVAALEGGRDYSCPALGRLEGLLGRRLEILGTFPNSSRIDECVFALKAVREELERLSGD